MTGALVVAAALCLDAVLGEPRRYHPLIAFGRWAKAIESRLYRPTRMAGLVALALALLPPVLFTWFLALYLPEPLLCAVLLYLAVGRRSLREHAQPIAAALRAGDLNTARQRVAWIVSRDTRNLDQPAIARATVESVLENGCDAIFGAIFWALLGGPAAVVLYRLSNTLDAMWGYKNDRYTHFGWGAARLDDLLNVLPARLTALGYALAGDARRGLRCWRAQGRQWKSPNAGPVMATGAGSLGLLLGGSASYHGATQPRPALGEGRVPAAADIDASLRLIDRALALWLAAITCIALIAIALN